MIYIYYTFVKSMLIRIKSNGEKGGPPPVFPVSIHGQLSMLLWEQLPGGPSGKGKAS